MEARQRIREAVLDLVFDHGCDGTSLEMILDRADVDRAAFLREFDGREDCFLAIYTETNDWFVGAVFAAFESGETWRDSLRAAAYVAARFLRDHPREVRLNVIQVFRASEMAAAERDRYHQLLVDLVDAGRQELDDPDSVSRSVAEGVVGSILGLMVKEVGAEGSAAGAEAAVPELMYIAVRPYLGHEAAREELPRSHRPRRRLALDERERIREAMIDVTLERGYGGTTTGLVATRAGVEEAVFKRHFTDKEDCYLETFHEYVQIFEGRVLGAFEREEGWRDALRAAAYAAAGFIRDYPRPTRFGSTAILGAGPVPQAHSGNFLQRIVDLVDAGRQELDDPDSMSRGVAEGVLGAVYESLIRELRKGEVKDPEEFVPELMYLAVRPYLGHEAAREELSVPPPSRSEETHLG